MIGSRTVAWIGRALVVVAVPALARAQQAPPTSGEPALVAASPGAAGWTWVPAKGSATATLRQTIALDLRSASLHAALEIIGQRAGLSILYGPDVAAVRVPISLRVDNMTVGEALDRVLEGTGLEAYVSLHGSAVLVRREKPRAAQAGATVTGRVTDAVTHTRLDQVAVRVEGPGLGTLTTADGRYAVHNIPPGTYRVTARRVGYTPSTVTVTAVADSTITIDFALTAAATKLNEVVTTAVGDQRRYEVGNVISTINADSIAPTAPITSLTDLISARAPGVEVEETSGLTGSGEAIRIRGQSSLVLQSDPIIVVDGVRLDNTAGGTASPVKFFAVGGYQPSPSRLNDLAFTDIQSIDVLKGPAASTEYGTDAANGVIVITTRRGQAGRPQWHLSAEETASGIPERFPRLYYSWGHTTTANPVNCPIAPDPYGSGYGWAARSCVLDSTTSWNPLNDSHYSIFGSGNRGKYDLSVSGGSDALRYHVSGAMSNETGVLRLPAALEPEAHALGLPHSAFTPNGEDQRSVRMNTAIRLGATTDLTISGAYLSAYQQSPDAQELFSGVVLFPALRDSANEYGYGGGRFDPVYQFGHPTNQTTNRLTGGVTGNWRPTLWLVTHATVGIDHGSQRNEAILLPQVAALWPYTPAQLGIANATTDIYTVDLRGSATAALTHAVRAVTSVGLQLADMRTQGTTATASGVTATNLTLNGAVNPTVTQLGDRRATLGGYGEEQIGVSERLFVTGAVRVDAGSGFGRDYSTAIYPKASVSWLVLNGGPTALRLRGAFGQSGVQPPNGAALELYAPAIVWYGGAPTSVVAIANSENPHLQPERSSEYEGGLDLGLWQNRVGLELTGYSKTTKNALVSTGTGWEAGGYPYEGNVGNVRNVGAEATVTATAVRRRTVSWDLTLNASVNRNKLTSLAPGALSQQLTNPANGAPGLFRFTAGYPLYGYWAPRVQYADTNHDGVLQPDEVTLGDSLSYIGSSLPTREASLGTHVGLWGDALGIGALVDYRGGFRLADGSAAFEAVTQSDAGSNLRSSPLWQQARNIGLYAIYRAGRFDYSPPAGFYEDATFLRVREVSLTYEFPHSVVHAIRLANVSLTAAVRNLALWTRYGGVDPEVTNARGTNTQLNPTSNTYTVNNDMRQDIATVPLLRYWVIRLNAGW